MTDHSNLVLATEIDFNWLDVLVADGCESRQPIVALGGFCGTGGHGSGINRVD